MILVIAFNYKLLERFLLREVHALSCYVPYYSLLILCFSPRNGHSRQRVRLHLNPWRRDQVLRSYKVTHQIPDYEYMQPVVLWIRRYHTDSAT
jgi:hypothetical protein